MVIRLHSPLGTDHDGFCKESFWFVFLHCELLQEYNEDKNSFNNSVTNSDLHFPARSTKGAPPRIAVLCWSRVLVHMFLQRLGPVLVCHFTRTGHLEASENWPEQIHKWHLHLLLCTRLWSVVQTPGGISMIYRWAQVWRQHENDFSRGCWEAGRRTPRISNSSCQRPWRADSRGPKWRTCRLTVGGILRSKLMSISDGMTL